MVNKMNFEWTDKSQKAIRISRVETSKSFTIAKKHCEAIKKLVKKGDKKGAFDYIRGNCDYLNDLELDSKAKKAGKCQNTAMDTRYRLFEMLVEEHGLQVYNKREDVKTVAKAMKKGSKIVKRAKAKAKK